MTITVYSMNFNGFWLLSSQLLISICIFFNAAVLLVVSAEPELARLATTEHNTHVSNLCIALFQHVFRMSFIVVSTQISGFLF